MPDILANPAVKNAFSAIAQAQPQPGANHILKNALNGGELSPTLAARIDQQRHLSGCHKLENFIPLATGGITRRPGFEHLGAAHNTDQAYSVRLLPFIFSQSQTLMLELWEAADNTTRLSTWSAGGLRSGSLLVLPWSRNVLPTVSFCQSGDVIYCASRHFRPGKIMRYSDTDWRYRTINWLPSISRPVIASIECKGQGSGSWTTRYYVVTAIDGETGEESMPSAPRSVQTMQLSQTHYVELSITPVNGASEYRVYKKSAGVFGFIGRITEGTTFQDMNIQADTEDAPPNWTDPFAGNNPQVVFMHQQRLGFAASSQKPLTIWLSQAGNLESMAASIPPKSDDAIEATLAAPQANAILWCKSDRGGLALGTEGGEWLLTSSEGAAISPSDLSFQPQTSYGSQAGLEPLACGSALLYIQRGGTALREYGYSFADDRYKSQDLSLLARHILEDNPVVSWAWQPEPHGIIWCCLNDGALAGLTYLAEHEVIAWHRHSTDAWIEQIASMPGPTGVWQLWGLVQRKISGQWVRQVWRMRSFQDPDHTDGQPPSTFTSVCAPCIPESQNETGSTFGLLKKINAVKLRLLDSTPFSLRVTGQDAKPGAPCAVKGSIKSGVPCDRAIFPGAGWREGAGLEITCSGPGPATILGLTLALEYSEAIGAQI